MTHRKVKIIAEAGINHNGSLKVAKELVEIAAWAGADIVKFQTFRAVDVVTRKAPKAQYQMNTTSKKESQYDLIKKLELSRNNHFELARYCQRRRIQFLSSPFDLASVDFLVKNLGLDLVKVASGEITNAPLLLKIAKYGKRIILSTGMCSLGEIETALAVIGYGYSKFHEPPSIKAFFASLFSDSAQRLLRSRVVLLHCTTEYPAPYNDVNLKAMDTLKSAFGLPVGLSDHTRGIEVAIAAVSRGACAIEKHFTTSRALPGPDHKASLEPNELKEMVTCIRHVEKALGDGLKIPARSEMKNIAIARKSIVASRFIRKGQTLSERDLTTKRPGDGTSPLLYWDLIGKRTIRSYEKDDMVEL